MKNILTTILILVFLGLFIYNSYQLIDQNRRSKIVFNNLEEILDTSANSRYETITKDSMVYDSTAKKYTKQTFTYHKPHNFITIKNLWQDFRVEIDYPKRIEAGKMTDIVLTVIKKDDNNKEPLDLSAQLFLHEGFFIVVDSSNHVKEVLTENKWIWTKIFEKNLGVEIRIKDHKSDLSFEPKFEIEIYKSRTNMFITFMQENTWLSWFLTGLATIGLFVLKLLKAKKKKAYT